MSAQGLVWISALPVLLGLAALAFRRREDSEGPAALLLAAFGLGAVLVVQLGIALERSDAARVIDLGVPWLGALGPAGELGFVADPHRLVPLFAALVVGLTVAMRSVTSAVERLGGGWLAVAIGGGALVMTSRSAIGVVAGWWLAGWALRRLRPGGEGAHGWSDAAAALALFAAIEATGTVDLVAQRAASVWPLRDPWVGSISRADVIVGAWFVALGARVHAMTAGRRPDDALASSAGLGAAVVLPWIAVSMQLGPWLGSAPQVGAIAVALALGTATTAALSAGWSPAEGPISITDDLARIGPAFAAVAVLSGGGFAAVELAVVYSIALPALVATAEAGRRDGLGLVAAVGLVGCAPLAGHFGTSASLLWIHGHESAASPGINGAGLALALVVLVAAVVGATRLLRDFCDRDNPIDTATILTRAGLATLLLALTIVLAPDELGGPSSLAAFVGGTDLGSIYGARAVGEASEYFVGPRPSVADPEGRFAAGPRVRAQVLALLPAIVWVGIGVRDRIRPRAHPAAGSASVRPSAMWTRGPLAIVALGRRVVALPLVALRGVHTVIAIILVVGIAHDGSRLWRTARDRVAALVPTRRVPWSGVVIVALIAGVFGWLYLKPSVASLSPTAVHGFGGLHHRMQPVADPSRDRRRESDDARRIMEAAARAAGRVAKEPTRGEEVAEP